MKPKPNKKDCIYAYKWYEEISAIAEEAIEAITDALEQYVEGEKLILDRKYIDAVGNKIISISWGEIEDDEDVIIECEDCVPSRLREEPIQIILDMVDYVNYKVYGCEPC